jgi:hypothetical protein
VKIRAEQYKDRWYFSHSGFLGLGAERTQAIYEPSKHRLTIIRTKCLREIFDYLKEHLDIIKITAVWHKESERDG